VPLLQGRDQVRPRRGAQPRQEGAAVRLQRRGPERSRFCLTQKGIDFGFEDQDCPNPDRHNGTHDDIKCCETHNSFAEPPGDSALKVAERDDQGFAETLFAAGQISGGGFVGEKPRVRVEGVPGGCVRRGFRIQVDIANAGDLRSTEVSLDGRLLERSGQSEFKVLIPARHLVSGSHTIKVVASARGGARDTATERFRRCPREPGFTGKR
jgi:hypothetical protein